MLYAKRLVRLDDRPPNKAMKRTLKGAGSISAVPFGINLFGLGDLGGRPSTPLTADPLGSSGDSLLEPSDSTWVPGFLFGLLGLFFLQKAIRPGAKQSWSWGRGGGPVPVSRWGYGSWAATFFVVAFIVTHGPRLPVASVFLFFVCFLVTLVVGFVDTHRYNKARRLSEPSRNQGT